MKNRTKHIDETVSSRTISKLCKEYLCDADKVRVINNEVHYLYYQHPSNFESNGKWTFGGWLKDIVADINREIDYRAGKGC
jgi:hypothetical protein